MACICCGLAGCAPSDREVLVGVAGPMTGSDAQMGADFQKGVSLAVEEWNSRGGVLGRTIKTVLVDDQSDSAQAVVAAQKLVKDRVAGVVGHYNSNCSIPASDVYHQASIPMITPASTNPLLTGRGYRGIFRVCGTDDQQGKAGADFVSRKLQAKRVAVLHDSTVYGKGLAELFMTHLGSSASIVYTGGIIRGSKDFRGVLREIREQRPDLVYFGGVYSEAGLLIKQARDLSLTVPFLSGDAAFDRKMIEVAGSSAAEGTYLTFSPNPENLPTARSFVEKYRARYGDPGAYSVYAYVAANVLFEALQAAGTTDGRAVAEKLHSLEFSTALGPIRFTEKGDVAQAPYMVWITRGGRLQEYWRPTE